MNCTGFVFHALVNSGGSPTDVPGMQGWEKLITANGVEHHTFYSKAALLESGLARKGDIIWMFDRDIGVNGLSDIHHVGIFWGDTPTDDKLWHSSPDAPGENGESLDYNAITEIAPLANNVIYWLVKTGNDARIEIACEDVLPEVRMASEEYSLEGAEFGIYNTEVDAESDSGRIETLTTLSDGKAYSQILGYGTYYVKQLSASPGMTAGNEVRQVLLSDATINSAIHVPLSFEAVPQTATLELDVQGDREEPALEDAVYAVYRVGPETKIGEIVIDAHGSGNLAGIGYGDYRIEIKGAVPKRYHLAETEFSITAGEDHVVITIDKSAMPAIFFIALAMILALIIIMTALRIRKGSFRAKVRREQRRRRIRNEMA
jgi:hypothetical protein